MKHCGKKWRININTDDDSFRINVQVGLYLSEYDNITLHSMIIQDSKGSALYLGKNEYNSKGNFVMDSCKIQNGSVNQNSISGGIVIDTYGSETVRLSNSSIINNGDGSQSHDIYCSPIGAIAGIVVTGLPDEIVIDSCVITNNTRGLVVYGDFDSIEIYIFNTVLINYIDSEVVFHDWWPDVRISLYEVTINSFSIVMPNSFFPLIWHSFSNGYSFGNGVLNVSVGHGCSDYSLNLMENDFRKCISQQGICSGQDYSGYCPTSYSQCVGNYCPCSEIRNGTLCGQCIDGYSVAINSPYMSCVPCNSSTVYKGWALLIALELFQ